MDYSSLENPDFIEEEFALGIRFNHSGKHFMKRIMNWDIFAAFSAKRS